MSGRALGPGATVGVLGTGVPRLACLRPAAWLHQQPGTAQFGSNNTRPSRGAKPREADDTKTSLGVASLGWLPRSGDIYAGGTSRGSHDESRDDQGQAGASGRSVLVSSSLQQRQATGAESRGISQRFPFRCNKTKTANTTGRRSSPSPPRRHDQRLFVGEDYFCQDKLYYLSPFKSGRCGIPSHSYLGRGPRPL